jgi:predicted enzyme related to lactoylglutathione lyase
MGADAGNYTMLRKDGKDVAGLGPIQGPNQPPAWATYLATDDVDATAALVTANGGTVMFPPMDVFDSGRMTFALDPTGAAFGLWQAKQHIGSRIVNEPGAVVWNELNTRSIDAAKPFYEALFGWTFRPMGDGARNYQVILLGNRAVGGSMQMDGPMWDGIPPHWMVYFAVESPDATAERVVELGGKVLVPPFDIPVGRMAVVQDSTGAAFSVTKLHEIDDPNTGWD